MLSRWQITIMGLSLLGLAVVPPLAVGLDEPFYMSLIARIMIFAIAAVSLDLILGFGGMVSFGHAAYLGTGGYAVAILSFYGIDNGYLQCAAAILGSGLIALIIGAISLRTSGVYFIMITLAFTQMLFFLGIIPLGACRFLSSKEIKSLKKLVMNEPEPVKARRKKRA